MKRNTSLFVVLALAAIVAVVPVANGQTVHFNGAGSSAMYQGFAVAAYNDLALAAVVNVAPCNGQGVTGTNGVTCSAFHWSIKSAVATVAVVDAAAGAPNEGGNVWVVYTTCVATGATACPRATSAGASDTLHVMDIWDDVSIDSTVGNREYLRRDAAGHSATTLFAAAATTTAGANVISATNFTGNAADVNSSLGGLAADAQTKLNGLPLTAGLSDIRMEDALYATLRILATCPQAHPGTGCNTSNGSLGNVVNPCPSADTGVPAPTPCTDFPYFVGYSLGYGALWDPTIPAASPPANQVGTGIMDSFGGPTATPVSFALPGNNDPFSSFAVPSTIKTFAIGESPLLIIANRSNSSSGLGQLIGNIPSCNGNGNGSDVAYCVDDPVNGGPAAVPGAPGPGWPTDHSYLIRNMWDQHPYPPVDHRFPDTTYTPARAGEGYCANAANSATGPCKILRRPSGAFFAGYLEETANTAFTWPLDSALQGNRVLFPTTGCPACMSEPITVIVREPLSGTYNAFDYTVVRRMGGTNGNYNWNGTTNWMYGPYLSVDTFVDGSGTPPPAGAAFNPLSFPAQAAFAEPCDPAHLNVFGGCGLRKRGVGTGQIVNNVKATADSIGYAFFSFGNVGAIKASPLYGYLMIDGVDPLINGYNNPLNEDNSVANCIVLPSHNCAADPATPTTWGELPECTTGGAGPGPDCKANAIWDTTHACAGGAINANGCTFPHLRDGTYPAWSELRMLCDPGPAGVSCSTAQDALGAESLVQHLQQDIHNSALGGVPDLLPFDDAGAWNGPFGDVSFIRDHSAVVTSAFGALLDGAPALLPGCNYSSYILADDNQDTNHNYCPYISLQTAPGSPQTSRQSMPGMGTLCGGGQGTNTPPNAECGGDAGGFVLPVAGAGSRVASLGQQQ